MRLSVAALLAVLLAGATAAWAAEPIVMAGRIVFRVQDPGASSSAAARVDGIDKHVCNAISNEDVGHPKMKVAKHHGLWSVYIGKTFLVSVYSGDAKLYGMSEKKLADDWAYKLKKAFPLVQPMSRVVDKAAATRMDKLTKAELTRKIKVPHQDWGLVDLYLVLLWKARQVKPAMQAEQDPILKATMLEDAARHFIAPQDTVDGHAPGTCPRLSTCELCQAMMKASIAVPDAEHDTAANLAQALASDADAQRAVSEVLSYVRGISGTRFMDERVRIGYKLWQRLDNRAKVLAGAPKPAQQAAAPAGSAAKPAAGG